MPLFEYRCQKCGQTFEKVVRPSDGIKIACPSCQSESVKKAISVFACGRAGAGVTSCAPSG